MTTTIGTLAERALRRLGVAIIPVADRPPLMVQVPRAEIATAALVELGVIVPDETASAPVPRDNIATAALIELGVIASDEAPPPTDLALARDRLASVQAALAAQAVVSWPDDTVPQAVAEEYVKLTANVMATSFGKAADAATHAMLEARVHKVALVMQAPALALAKLAAVQASLASQALVWWPDDAVPQAVAEEYTKLVVHALAPAFGQKVDPAHQAVLEARVRKVALVLSAPDVATEAVLAVHRDLAARGLVRWSSFDVPPAAEDPYTVLAADRMAPQFSVKTDPRDAVQAMRSLAQIIALPTSGERVPAEYY